MPVFWEQVENLRGQTLYTKTGRAFQVASVDKQYVTVIPERTGAARPIRRLELEAAYNLYLPDAELTATRLVKEKVTVFNPVYIVSILKATEVTMRDKPKAQASDDFHTKSDNAEMFISQLERIVQLHQNGLLSDQDFAQAKLKLLKATE